MLKVGFSSSTEMMAPIQTCPYQFVKVLIQNYDYKQSQNFITIIIQFWLVIISPKYIPYKQQIKNMSNQKAANKFKADFSYLSAFNYNITKEIGRGSFGVVYKAHELKNQKNLRAIKINFNTISRQLIYAEMAFLMIVKQRSRLPKLVNLFVYHDITHIVLQYFKYKPFITFFHTMSVQDIKHYLYQLLLGLKELKDLGIYHRDIKPGNFLYNPENKRGVIIDFGLAEIDPSFKNNLEDKVTQMKAEGNTTNFQQLNKKKKIYKKLNECLKIIGRNKIGTETYMPIQSILHHRNQDYQSDMWPVGVILLQFVTRKYNVFNSVRILNKPPDIKNPYYITYLIELATFFGSEAVINECKKLSYEIRLPSDIDRLTWKEVSNLQGFDDVLEDLLNRLLTLDSRKRISVEEALKHQFFDGIREEHE